ncbi:hypothetical protein FA95DRAFT_1562082, partial [Auriscalpium vulgare]
MSHIWYAFAKPKTRPWMELTAAEDDPDWSKILDAILYSWAMLMRQKSMPTSDSDFAHDPLYDATATDKMPQQHLALSASGIAGDACFRNYEPPTLSSMSSDQILRKRRNICMLRPRMQPPADERPDNAPTRHSGAPLHTKRCLGILEPVFL